VEKANLKDVRASLRLTQKELAALARVAQQTITDIETEKKRPRRITAYAIVDALNVKLREKGREEITVESLDWNPL
jgi:DNA-binding XRE family transcriptional regulator